MGRKSTKVQFKNKKKDGQTAKKISRQPSLLDAHSEHLHATFQNGSKTPTVCLNHKLWKDKRY